MPNATNASPRMQGLPPMTSELIVIRLSSRTSSTTIPCVGAIPFGRPGQAVRLRQQRFIMSEQVEAIVQAVQGLDAEQRRELTDALADIEISRVSVAGGRKQLVDSIRGKYRHVPTSSEAFINRKREDNSLESRS